MILTTVRRSGVRLLAAWDRQWFVAWEAKARADRGREVAAMLSRFAFARDRAVDRRMRFITLTAEQRLDLLHFASWARARQDRWSE